MTPLEREIRTIIETEGPMTVSDYMQLCLAHPRHGYYVTRDPLGAGGDFVTAPEVSQMFGELIGAWAAAVWQQMGSPRKVQLVELGPGRGTLMADALRAASGTAGISRRAFGASGRDQARSCARGRRQTLASRRSNRTGIEHDRGRPDGPAIAIANEFVDALPVDQFVKDRDGWHAAHGRHRRRQARLHGRRPMPLLEDFNDESATRRPARSWNGATTSQSRCCRAASRADGGAALIIDYGHARARLRRHAAGGARAPIRRSARPIPAKPISPRRSISPRSPCAARRQGAATHGPVTQGEFLRRLGIERARRAAARRRRRRSRPPISTRRSRA